MVGASCPIPAACSRPACEPAPITIPETVVVSVTPASVTLEPDAAQQFTATVTGSANTDVTWTVEEGSGCGSITQAGLYTAPGSPATCHVRATSAADGTRSDTATVTVRDSGNVSAGYPFQGYTSHPRRLPGPGGRRGRTRASSSSTRLSGSTSDGQRDDRPRLAAVGAHALLPARHPVRDVGHDRPGRFVAWIESPYCQRARPDRAIAGHHALPRGARSFAPMTSSCSTCGSAWGGTVGGYRRAAIR